ncbi:alpha/beta fold hydrolase [Patescibacteria group bacterium]|nr:alpha/beta fold hydrolase [Patescibacteria group bacterium]MBU0964328.1 alpha/beta fold hydrolase [Patescibacteria group bacterium]
MIFNILSAIAILLFFSFGFSWFIARQICRSPREIKKEEWKNYSLEPEVISFKTSDGLKLVGAFIKGNNKGTIILLHGYGRSKEQMLPQASFLNKRGYNILMFDFRASGESEGKFITFGQMEQYDLEGAVEFLKARHEVEMNKIGLLGFSMGGAVALMKSGDLPQIKAIVISSTYARFKSVIWQNFKLYFRGLPFFPMGYFVLWIIKYRTGIYYPRITPIKYIAKLKARPLMMIHGAHDKRVPLSDAYEIYKQAPWLKEFWLVRQAAHEDTYTITKDHYEDKVSSFFDKYVLGR